MKKPIDIVDSKIIRLLQRDGRMPNTEIAKTLGISEATVRNRLQRLIEEQIIQIVAVGNPFKLGFGIVGSMRIRIDVKKVQNVTEELSKLRELWYIALATGGTDVDIEFNATSLEDLRVLIFEKITKIDGIKGLETSLILEYVKRQYDWGTGLEIDKACEPLVVFRQLQSSKPRIGG